MKYYSILFLILILPFSFLLGQNFKAAYPEYNMDLDAHAGVGFMVFTTAGQDPILKEHYEGTRAGLDAGLKVHFRVADNLRIGLKGTYFTSSNTTGNISLTNGSQTFSGELKDEYQVIFSGVSGAYALSDNGSVRFGVIFSLGTCFFQNDGIFVVDTFRINSVSYAYEMGVNIGIRLSEHLSLIGEIRYMSSVAYDLNFKNYSGNIPNLIVDSWDLRRFNIGAGLRYSLWKRKNSGSTPSRRNSTPKDDYTPRRFE